MDFIGIILSPFFFYLTGLITVFFPLSIFILILSIISEKLFGFDLYGFILKPISNLSDKTILLWGNILLVLLGFPVFYWLTQNGYL
tara:strand:+ start:156 stop:413 length:258 start_codon:yes stop_codon:yes gene_type:complete